MSQDHRQPAARRCSIEDGAHHGGAGDDQDGSEHDCGLHRHPEEQPREKSGTAPGDRDAQDEQASDDDTGVSGQVIEHQVEATVEQDDGHGEAHQRLERRPQELVRVDGRNERPSRETHRKQHDDRRYADLRSDHLTGHRQGKDERKTDEDLGRGHAADFASMQEGRDRPIKTTPRTPLWAPRSGRTTTVVTAWSIDLVSGEPCVYVGLYSAPPPPLLRRSRRWPLFR